MKPKRPTAGRKIATEAFRRGGWSEPELQNYIYERCDSSEYWLERRIDAAIARRDAKWRRAVKAFVGFPMDSNIIDHVMNNRPDSELKRKGKR